MLRFVFHFVDLPNALGFLLTRDWLAYYDIKSAFLQQFFKSFWNDIFFIFNEHIVKM